MRGLRIPELCAPRWRIWSLIGFLVLACVGSARAQVPPDTVPPDPAPPDTILVPIPPEQLPPDAPPVDTLTEEPRDTIPTWVFPRYAEPLPSGWSFARWEWDRQQLQLYRGLTILEFLERAPGLTVIRAGDHGYPVGITALGLGGGRVRVFIDGIEWDPLGFASPDLQQMGTGNLESVRISRDPTGIRIDLAILPLPEDDAMFSAIEAATGVYGSRILRGFLVRGFGRRVVFKGAYDAVTTDGWAFQSPFSLVSTHVSVSYALSERTGLQAELRHSGVQRLGTGLRENADHRMVFLRGRTELMPNLLVDGAVGRTWRLPATGDPLTAELAATQAFLRAGYVADGASLEAVVRGRDGGTLGVSGRPGFEAALRGSLQLGALVATEGEARMAGLGGGTPLLRGTVRLGPREGPGVFAGVTAGEYPAPLVSDVTFEVPTDGEQEGELLEITEPRYSLLDSNAGSVRVGGSWTRGGFSLAAAGVALPAGMVAPFGAAFDRDVGPLGAGAARGVETHLSLPVPGTFGALRLEGWGEYWLEQGGRYYLPARQARAAAVVHRTFFGGQLEPLVRFQVTHRGPMNVPRLETGEPLATAQYTLANLLIQIRILDVQMFGLWENAFDYRAAADIPGNPLPGLRLIYGFRWVFQD